MESSDKRATTPAGVQTIQVLERAFDVLEALSDSHGGIGVSSLAEKTGLSKTTTHRILQTLAERGYAEKTLENLYELGPQPFILMSRHINSLELQVEARPYLLALEHSLRLPAYLGVLDGAFVSIIGKESESKADEDFTRVGKRYPAHCSSMGKVLLSCLSADELDEALYDFRFEPHTPNTITSRREFVRHLRDVRRNGWAADCEESEFDHRCIAAPIFDFSGGAIAAIGVSGSNDDLPETSFEHIAAQVKRAAAGISRRMGYVD